MAETPRIYTVAQLAQILQLAPTTVRTKARNGSWPYLAFGPQTIRFTEDHLTRILTTSEAAPPTTRTTRRTRRTK